MSVAVAQSEQVIWHGVFYALAAAGAIANAWLVLCVLVDGELRRRAVHWLLATVAFAHIVQAVLYTPWEYKDLLIGRPVLTRTDLCSDADRFAPTWAYWMCQSKPIIVYSAYLVEALAVCAMAGVCMHLLRMKHRPIDMTFGRCKMALVCACILPVAIGLAVPWGFFRSVVDRTM